MTGIDVDKLLHGYRLLFLPSGHTRAGGTPSSSGHGVRPSRRCGHESSENAPSKGSRFSGRTVTFIDSPPSVPAVPVLPPPLVASGRPACATSPDPGDRGVGPPRISRFCYRTIEGAIGTVKSETACFAAVCPAKHMSHGTVTALPKRRVSSSACECWPVARRIVETARVEERGVNVHRVGPAQPGHL